MERVLGIKGGEAIGKFNRNVLIAIATAAINFSILVHKENLLSPSDRQRLLNITGILLREQSDSEVLYRALVALGTVLSTAKAKALGVDGIQGWIGEAAKKAEEDRVKAVAEECKKLV